MRMWFLLGLIILGWPVLAVAVGTVLGTCLRRARTITETQERWCVSSPARSASADFDRWREDDRAHHPGNRQEVPGSRRHRHRHRPA